MRPSKLYKDEVANTSHKNSWVDTVECLFKKRGFHFSLDHNKEEFEMGKPPTLLIINVNYVYNCLPAGR